eukprot:CFRG1771T1
MVPDCTQKILKAENSASHKKQMSFYRVAIGLTIQSEGRFAWQTKLAFRLNGAKGFGYNSTADEVTKHTDLTGNTYLITGINSGLGQESGRVLALRGASIFGLARTEGKARDALKLFEGDGEKIDVACELCEPESIRTAIAKVKATHRTIDVILCNAGIMALPALVLIRSLPTMLDILFW